MVRYKTRRQKTSENLGLKYVEYRRILVEIRELVGLGERATPKEVVEAVRILVGKEKIDDDVKS